MPAVAQKLKPSTHARIPELDAAPALRFASFDAVIRAAMDHASQIPQDAAPVALAWILEDEALLAMLMKPLLYKACLERCRHAQHNARALATGAPVYGAPAMRTASASAIDRGAAI